jgi:hypothetical protein
MNKEVPGSRCPVSGVDLKQEPETRNQEPITRNQLIKCLGCGCDDDHTCHDALGDPCRWIRISPTLGLGLCSECEDHLADYKKLCQREWSKRWRKRHPDQVREMNRRYLPAYRPIWRARNREKINRASARRMLKKYYELKQDLPDEFKKLLAKVREWEAAAKARDPQEFLARHAEYNRHYRVRQQVEREFKGLRQSALSLAKAEGYGPYLPKRAGRKVTTRKCLKCDREFQSDGSHNRICDPCRTANANLVEINGQAGDRIPMMEEG